MRGGLLGWVCGGTSSTSLDAGELSLRARFESNFKFDCNLVLKYLTWGVSKS
jgi:hypothetical protein